jgi:hypothetical protein
MHSDFLGYFQVQTHLGNPEIKQCACYQADQTEICLSTASAVSDIDK